MSKQRQDRMQVHQMSIGQFEKQFQDEDDCKSYLANNRWPVAVICYLSPLRCCRRYRTRHERLALDVLQMRPRRLSLFGAGWHNL